MRASLIADVPTNEDLCHAQLKRKKTHRRRGTGMVLLKNSGGLPLKANVKLAVVGPLGDDAQAYKSDYAGAGDDSTDTIFAALQRANQGTTTFAMGVPVTGVHPNTTAAALEMVAAADVTVLCIGITKAQEHEGMDRSDTLLPAGQQALATSVFTAAGSKPVIVILCNGGAVSIDDLVQPSAAVIEAFNPAQQGPKALAALMFGHENRERRLWRGLYRRVGLCPLHRHDLVACARESQAGVSCLSQSIRNLTAAGSRSRTWSMTRRQGAPTATTRATRSSNSAMACL